MTNDEMKLQIAHLNFFAIKMEKVLGLVVNHLPEVAKLLTPESIAELDEEAFKILTKKFNGLEMVRRPKEEKASPEAPTA